MIKQTLKKVTLVALLTMPLGLAQAAFATEVEPVEVRASDSIKGLEGSVERHKPRIGKPSPHPDIKHKILKRTKPTKASFSVTASEVVENDVIRITLFSEVDSISDQDVHPKLIDSMHKALQAIGPVEGAKVLSNGFRVSPHYDSTRQMSSWRGRAQLLIESRDFELAAQLASKAADHMGIASISYAVSDERRAQVENELVEKAGKLFKKRAKALTKSIGFHRYNITDVELHHQNHNPMPRMMARAASFEAISADAMPVPTPGSEERISVVMSGSIEMTKKKQKHRKGETLLRNS